MDDSYLIEIIWLVFLLCWWYLTLKHFREEEINDNKIMNKNKNNGKIL